LSFAEKTAKRRIALRLLFATTVAHDERWNTSHNLGDAGDEGAFRSGCASPRVVRFGASEALGRVHATERQCRRTGDTRGRRPDLSDSRLTVRIRPDDQMLLRERAGGAGDGAGQPTCRSLTRSHPEISLRRYRRAEWLTLERIVTELSKLGRNINQIARAANRGERVTDSGSNQFRAMLTICEALRVQHQGMLQTNAESWQQGYEDPQ